jgi:hypothetical protein
MTEAEWHWLNQPEEMWNFVGKTASERKWRLLATACCRCIWPMLGIDSRAAVEVAERFADGEASESERVTACVSASNWNYDLGPGERAVVQAAEYATARQDLVGLCHPAVMQVLTLTENDASQPLSNILRDIFGNPFRPVIFDAEWRTSTAVTLARQMYDNRDFNAMTILADALQDAGCDDEVILNHCHYPEWMHVRGCWVVDLVLGKE